MDKERQRKLDARARRKDSLNNSNLTIAEKKEEPKDEVRQTKAKPKVETEKTKKAATEVKSKKDVVSKKKHNSKGKK